MEKHAINYCDGDEYKSWNMGKAAVLADWEIDIKNLEHHKKMVDKSKILYDGCRKMKEILDDKTQELTPEIRKRYELHAASGTRLFMEMTKETLMKSGQYSDSFQKEQTTSDRFCSSCLLRRPKSRIGFSAIRFTFKILSLAALTADLVLDLKYLANI